MHYHLLWYVTVWYLTTKVVVALLVTACPLENEPFCFIQQKWAVCFEIKLLIEIATEICGCSVRARTNFFFTPRCKFREIDVSEKLITSLSLAFFFYAQRDFCSILF